MLRLYYFAAWTDSGFLIGCDHEHPTVISAAHCIANAGGYVIAIEDGRLRALNENEEKEFQFALGTSTDEREPRIFVPIPHTKWLLN